jgi:hypothetical protein
MSEIEGHTNRGFGIYKKRVETDYGHVVSIHESSVATHHCAWMTIENDGSKPGCESFKLNDSVSIHMSEEQAAQIRDGLTSFLGGDLPVLSMETFELWVESLDGPALAKAHKIMATRVTEQLELWD